MESHWMNRWLEAVAEYLPSQNQGTLSASHQNKGVWYSMLQYIINIETYLNIVHTKYAFLHSILRLGFPGNYALDAAPHCPWWRSQCNFLVWLWSCRFTTAVLVGSNSIWAFTQLASRTRSHHRGATVWSDSAKWVTHPGAFMNLYPKSTEEMPKLGWRQHPSV